MRERIARHQRDRAERVPGLQTVEEPHDVAAAVALHSTPQTLLVVDCLTLWLTRWTMPVGVEAMSFEQKQALALDWKAQAAMFLIAVRKSPGPVVLVGNEIGLGVIPMGREVRAFVDALGTLNQQVAQVCPRVSRCMAAGLPLDLERTSLMKPTPVRRILWVIAIVIALGLLMAGLAQCTARAHQGRQGPRGLAAPSARSAS